jgi:hypothetical protein
MTPYELTTSHLDPMGIHPRDAERLLRIARNLKRLWRRSNRRRSRYWMRCLIAAEYRAMIRARDIVARDPYVWNFRLHGLYFKTVGERMTHNLALSREELKAGIFSRARS